MSATKAKAIAKKLRAEADIADRPGQWARLNDLADEVEALFPKTPPRSKCKHTHTRAEGKLVGMVVCLDCGERVVK